MDKEEVLIRIKLLIDKYFENVGRNDYNTDDLRINLIDNIDFILDGIELDKKKMVLMKFDEDDKS